MGLGEPWLGYCRVRHTLTHTHTRRAREEGATSQLGRWCNGAAYSSRAAQSAGTQSAVEDEAPAGEKEASSTSSTGGGSEEPGYWN